MWHAFLAVLAVIRQATQALCHVFKSTGTNALLHGVVGVSASHTHSVLQQPILLVR